ncbi:uncharacterized protein LOC113342404 [Papaver somniferum]|uniref:uncharacterized protein LOC113342404 n=1 Tax=Papaver somniferum TaxID=3469 RepID=UPI000E6F633B|nr:uncharacterized protein LOC113342404 [Papaver somniferum]
MHAMDSIDCCLYKLSPKITEQHQSHQFDMLMEAEVGRCILRISIDHLGIVTIVKYYGNGWDLGDTILLLINYYLLVGTEQDIPLWEILIFKYPTSNGAATTVFKLHRAIEGYIHSWVLCLAAYKDMIIPLFFLVFYAI